MSLAFDEFGRPYIIVREQEKKKRLKGLDAVKTNLHAALAISQTLRSSLGPKGMDKMIVGPDGDAWVVGLWQAEVAADDALLRSDVAQILTAIALHHLRR